MKYFIGTILTAIGLLVCFFFYGMNKMLKDAGKANVSQLTSALSTGWGKTTATTSVASDKAGDLTRVMQAMVANSNLHQGNAHPKNDFFNAPQLESDPFKNKINPDASPRERLQQADDLLNQMRSENIQDNDAKLSSLKTALGVLYLDESSAGNVRALAIKALTGEQANSQTQNKTPEDINAERDFSISSYNLFLQTKPSQQEVVDVVWQALKTNSDPYVQQAILSDFALRYPDELDAFKSEPAYQNLDLSK